MSGFLERILESTAAEVERRRHLLSEEELRLAAKEQVERLKRRRRAFSEALSGEGLSVIAEFKRASPSKGDIHRDADIGEVARTYEQAGAAAMSVLTEESGFKGSLDDLRAARQACGLPILRKDFIIDGYQLLEAAEAGADAVLLIVAALSDRGLDDLGAEAAELGLECLVEVHDRQELEMALATGASMIGINNRNLRSFHVDLGTSLNLIKFIPDDVIVVGESGISNSDDVSRLFEAGFDAILVGEALMRATDPGKKMRELLSSL